MDSGVGFSLKSEDLIYDRFYQAEEDNLKLYRGAGLGLTISKSLVNLLGGEIWATSEFGKGTKFIFSFPMTDVEIIEQRTTLLDTDKPDVQWQGKSILVAEDEDINFIYIEELLKKFELKIHRAKNGLEAVNLYNQYKESIEIILMDIKMPVMGGYEAVNKIKEINSSIPIIAQTAFALSGEKENILKSGFDGYIAKPIKPNILIEMMEKFINISSPLSQ